MTDVAVALMEALSGQLDISSYFRSLRDCKVEAVFSWDDPMPGLARIHACPLPRG
jgi:predicted ATP-grasp superfamily ATP-dependent carboligase